MWWAHTVTDSAALEGVLDEVRRQDFCLALEEHELAVQALQPAALARTAERVATVIAERDRLFAALPGLPGVRRVYRSSGNYVLVRFADAQAAFDTLLAAGVVVRDQRAAPQLGDALRISIGSPEENDRVLAALSARRAAA